RARSSQSVDDNLRLPPVLTWTCKRPVVSLAISPAPERAVLAHHLDQHAFAQATVGDAQAQQRKGAPEGIEYGAAGEHEIGALDADAVVAGALLVAHAEQLVDSRGDVGIV